MRAPLVILLVGTLAACGPEPRHNAGVDVAGADDVMCPLACSSDLHSIVDCNNFTVTLCDGTLACDPMSFTCTDGCTAAELNHRSVGCDYYATNMDRTQTNFCFAAFIANTSTAPAHITVERMGTTLPIDQFARIPVGSGPTLTYGPYDNVAGLAPGQVTILFLGGDQGSAPLCPAPPAVPGASFTGTGISNAFHITTDVPVVAYQINPYGGGSVAVTAGSLLLPTSAWDVNYVAVNVAPFSTAASLPPSMDIIARDDGTIVSLTPNAAVLGGTGVPAGAAGTPINISLNKGQYVQITQQAELTGSVVTATKPVGFMAGHVCMNMPVGTPFCDHGEQMIPPVRALGSRYVGVMYRPRTAGETSTFWRLVGAVDGTTLTYSAAVGGPASINKGQALTFQTGTPFTVTSQDKDHPFMLFTYMTSSQFSPGGDGFGDPDFVVSVPPEQYLTEYVFFADPTYPETNLVIVRARGSDAQFHDVMLDCAGAIVNWTPIDADFQFARADLMTGNFANVGSCSTGRHEINSAAPFGLWVWGWGTPQTTQFTANVSYGYPGGMNVTPINSVILKPN
jgi:hypothetical protein